MTSDDKIEFRECLRIFRLRLRCDTGCVQITQHGIYFGIWILDGVLHTSCSMQDCTVSWTDQLYLAQPEGIRLFSVGRHYRLPTKLQEGNVFSL